MQVKAGCDNRIVSHGKYSRVKGSEILLILHEGHNAKLNVANEQILFLYINVVVYECNM